MRVENTHKAIISADDFETVQRLLKTDGRACQDKGAVNPFSGLLFCGDCGEQMVRRMVRRGDSVKVYFICSTKNRGEGCSRHSIEEETLKGLLGTAVRRYANDFLEQARLFEQIRGQEANLEAVMGMNSEVTRLKEEEQKYECLKTGLYEDLRQGIISREEFERFYRDFSMEAERLGNAGREQEKLICDMLRTGVVSAGKLEVLKGTMELTDIDRHTLTSMVNRILVFEKKRVEVEFNFYDEYRAMRLCTGVLNGRKTDGERSA